MLLEHGMFRRDATQKNVHVDTPHIFSRIGCPTFVKGLTGHPTNSIVSLNREKNSLLINNINNQPKTQGLKITHLTMKDVKR
jgi:hypothetical protein